MSEELINLLKRALYVWDHGYSVYPSSSLVEQIRAAIARLEDATAEHKPLIVPADPEDVFSNTIGGEG